MNTPWDEGIAKGGPLMPYGSNSKEFDYQPTRIPGYEVSYGSFTTLTKGVFLPAGSILPGGANFAHSATIPFPLHFPEGTTVPGGIMVPVSLVTEDSAKKKEKEEEAKKYERVPRDVLCCIQ